MTDTSVTYERTMTVTYPREAGNLSNRKMSDIQRHLAHYGLFMMPSYISSEPKLESYEKQDYTTQEKAYTLMDEDYEVHDFGVVSDSRELRGMRSILNVLLDRDYPQVRELELVTTTTEATVAKLPSWKGSNMWVSANTSTPWVHDYVNKVHGVYDDETDETDRTRMAVTLTINRDGEAILKFRIWKTAQRTQNKSDIELWLVENPLNDRGVIQANVEMCLEDVEYNIDEPIIDCHFDAKTESRSECTPDIIGRLRDAKRAASGA